MQSSPRDPPQGLQEGSSHPAQQEGAAAKAQGEGADRDMELTRWRERAWEGYGINETELGEAARRPGKWSAL